MRVTSVNNTALRWAAIAFALVAGLGEWLALMRARRRQHVAHDMAGWRQG